MSTTKHIQLGEKASFFHDPYSGVTISKGEVLEVKASQLSKRVKAALAQGHLAYAEPPSNGANSPVETKKVFTPEEILALGERLEKVSKDNVVKKEGEADTYNLPAIAKKFTLSELAALCEDNSIVVEESDTKVSLLEALLSDEE